MKEENKRCEASLRATIMDLRRQVAGQWKEIDSLKRGGGKGSTFGMDYHEGMSGGLSPADRSSIVRQVLDRSGFVKREHLRAKYVKWDQILDPDDLVTNKEMRRHLSALDPTQYVTHEELRKFDYVSHSSLQGMGFADSQEVTAAIDARLQGTQGLPTDFENCLLELEKQVSKPGGVFGLLEAKV